jgi:hypothetical protein
VVQTSVVLFRMASPHPHSSRRKLNFIAIYLVSLQLQSAIYPQSLMILAFCLVGHEHFAEFLVHRTLPSAS